MCTGAAAPHEDEASKESQVGGRRRCVSAGHGAGRGAASPAVAVTASGAGCHQLGASGRQFAAAASRYCRQPRASGSGQVADVVRGQDVKLRGGDAVLGGEPRRGVGAGDAQDLVGAARVQRDPAGGGRMCRQSHIQCTRAGAARVQRDPAGGRGWASGRRWAGGGRGRRVAAVRSEQWRGGGAACRAALPAVPAVPAAQQCHTARPSEAQPSPAGRLPARGAHHSVTSYTLPSTAIQASPSLLCWATWQAGQRSGGREGWRQVGVSRTAAPTRRPSAMEPAVPAGAGTCGAALHAALPTPVSRQRSGSHPRRRIARTQGSPPAHPHLLSKTHPPRRE